MPTKKWKWRCWQCSTLRNSGGVDDWRAAAARCKSTDVKDWFCKNTCKPKAAPIGLPPPEGWQGEPEDWEGKRKSASAADDEAPDDEQPTVQQQPEAAGNACASPCGSVPSCSDVHCVHCAQGRRADRAVERLPRQGAPIVVSVATSTPGRA